MGTTELKDEKQLNTSLRNNQDEWQIKVKKSEIELNVTKEIKDKEIFELKEQVRDLMFFLEAKEKVQESNFKDEIEEGDIVVPESQAQGSSRKISKELSA